MGEAASLSYSRRGQGKGAPPLAAVRPLWPQSKRYGNHRSVALFLKLWCSEFAPDLELVAVSVLASACATYLVLHSLIGTAFLFRHCHFAPPLPSAVSLHHALCLKLLLVALPRFDPLDVR